MVEVRCNKSAVNTLFPIGRARLAFRLFSVDGDIGAAFFCRRCKRAAHVYTCVSVVHTCPPLRWGSTCDA
ncbi:hypothetical protein EMCRGX_G017212 [Ephydatia muelleri]